MSTLTRPISRRFFAHRDLAALINLYEANYLRLSQLAPELQDIEYTAVSRVSGALPLYLTVLERFKYTTTINLTYRFGSAPEWAMEPNARLCVYHDVRAVELISHCRRRYSRQSLGWRRGRMPEVDRKWEMNRFLLKWLRFCTFQGHLFLNVSDGQDPEFDRWVRDGAGRPVREGRA